VKAYWFASRASALIAVVFSLTGCGGGGSHGPGSLVQSSPFRGQWAGEWEESPMSHGPVAVTVERDGDLTMVMTDYYSGLDGTGEGTVKSDGSFTFNYQYTGGEAMAGTGSFSPVPTGLEGNLVIRHRGEIETSAGFTLRKQ
jgi:hypothetical protein